MDGQPSKRKLTILERMGIAAITATSGYGGFAGYTAIKEHFFTREEGRAVETTLAEVKKQLKENNDEQTRVIEKKVDEIIDFMRDERETARRDNDRQDRRIENLEFVTLTKSRKER